MQIFVECQDRGWELDLTHLLFAYEEVPQESTGFLPLELYMGGRRKDPKVYSERLSRARLLFCGELCIKVLGEYNTHAGQAQMMV